MLGKYRYYKKMRIFRIIPATFGSMLLAGLVFAGWVKWQSLASDQQLAIKWEGFLVNHNFRDAGASLNQCLGHSFFVEGRFFRANSWFSGWTCSSLGNPEIIYSLDFDPERGDRYFCRSDQGLLVGRVFNQQLKLQDLEFLSTWDKKGVVDAVCPFFSDAYANLILGKKILVHCDAGKDRTGTFTALTAALIAEQKNQLDEKMLQAIECDYRRSKSLEKDKYGRMAAFISSLKTEGGVGAFLSHRCGIDAKILSQVGETLSQSPQ